jgi:ClpP class serine protease
VGKECFPRTADAPQQSPLFWVTHKDRYLRQLLIRDIEASTKRELVVYFTDVDNALNAMIDPGDDQLLHELLKGCAGKPVDLLLETPGGYTDATEKVCSLLRQMAPDLRVIVPRKAKSNGTVIALAGSSIVMSATSELGPIDPLVLGGIPAEFIIKQQNPAPNPIHLQFAHSAVKQTKDLATTLLRTGMLKGKTEPEIADIVEKLATKSLYASHGTVIDVREAQQLGLIVTEISVSDALWDQIWLLRTMYAFDCPRNGYAKVFESSKLSSAVQAKASPSP